MPAAVCRCVLPMGLVWIAATTAGAAELPPMQYGPVVCHSVTFVQPPNNDAPTWSGAVTRAINVALAGDTTLCYDAQRLAVAGLWQGGFLDTSKTHHTSYKGSLPPRPGATPAYTELELAGWESPAGELAADATALGGYYLHGDRAVLAYRVADREVLELPTASGPALGRTLRVGPGEAAVSLRIGHLREASFKIDGGNSDGPTATGVRENLALAARVVGDVQGVRLRDAEGSLLLDIPAGEAPRLLTVWFYAGDAKELAPFFKAAAAAEKPGDPAELTRGGPRRWPQAFTAQSDLGPDADAYTLDSLGVPEQPYGSWMRLSAMDFFDDGRLAVATLPGDVWIVSWPGSDITKATWRRCATGLYEPLGLKVVDGKIYVRGRDRITRLVDLNDDGEADYYEQFHAHGPIGPGYHAFIFDLNTDAEGNFWYVISGRKAPSIGEVIKLSADGKRFEVIADHFRHPNGMGIGGPQQWVTIADNPDGKFPSGASIVRKGQSYGQNGPRTQPFLYLLPPNVDTSSGSQCWTDQRFGPLGGAIIHTSYSTSSLTYVMTQNSQPHPSGFAVQFPFGTRAGVMRGRVSPRDGQVYVCGQRGWDSNAGQDGCLHRLRYTGSKAYLVTAAQATRAGVELTFSCPLDAKSVDFDNFFAQRTGDKPGAEVDIDEIVMLAENRVLVKLFSEDIDPRQLVDQAATDKLHKGGDPRTAYKVIPPIAITFNLKAADGRAWKDTVYCTINGLD